MAASDVYATLNAAGVAHHSAGRHYTHTGPVELRWAGGTSTVLDVGTDWMLEVEPGPWVDPFEGCTENEIEALEREVGIWLRLDDPADPLAAAIGRTVTAVRQRFNENNDIVGVVINLGDVVIHCDSYGGKLQTSVDSGQHGDRRQ